ncbi:MAG: YkgJ family cysteine cluster protein [Desulfobulbaceae bacterium]|nr:YkgJ family cysteine cluster protein [Desulfobulbaceae bacterium]
MSAPTGCKRCGACCQQGGPALHGGDLELVRSGRLRLDDLITVNLGELAFQPLATTATTVVHEFLKLQGRDGTWCCTFYDETARGCLRYADRPLACGLLDCTDTGPLLDIAGQDLLTRFDCIDHNDPILAIILKHQQQSPCPDMQTISQDFEPMATRVEFLASLLEAVNLDLAFRSRTATTFQLSVALELFYFGRPLFQLLLPLGIQAVNTPAGLWLNTQHGSTGP